MSLYDDAKKEGRQFDIKSHRDALAKNRRWLRQLTGKVKK